MYMLDTCICVDIMRGKLPYAYELMRHSSPSQFQVPAVVIAELEFGIANSSNPDKTRALTERFLAPFVVAGFNEKCARAYGQLRNHLKQQGLLIGPNDMLIAATALSEQAILVTNNAREFARIPGLAVENWYEIEW